eukprot:Opistho-2@73970
MASRQRRKVALQVAGLIVCVLYLFLNSNRGESGAPQDGTHAGGSSGRHLLSKSGRSEHGEMYAQSYEGAKENFTDAECQDIEDKLEKCLFVTTVTDCLPDSGFINYLKLPYCSLPHHYGFALMVLFLWMIFLFIALGTTAEEFFCPALSVISTTLNLSQNVAGVTFLALGNGAPDIFSVIASITASKDGAALAVGELAGSGLFVSTVVVGSVAIAVPFTVTRRPFLRDASFYLVAVGLTFGILADGKIHSWEAAVFVVLYVIYVGVVVIGRRVYQQRKADSERRRLLQKQNEEDVGEVSVAPVSGVQDPSSSSAHPGASVSKEATTAVAHTTQQHHVHGPNPHLLTTAIDVSIAVLGSNAISATCRHDCKSCNMSVNRQTEATPLLGGGKETEKELPWYTHLMRQLFVTFDVDVFTNDSAFGRILTIIKVPIVVLLRLSIPVVDEDEPNANWCKPLQLIQCFTAPVIAALITNLYADKLGSHFYLWELALIFGAAMFVLVLFTSETSKPPKYHVVFGFLGFLASVVWIYGIANEIVNLLESLGRIFKISNALLGLTVLAWGNSIGDYIANLTVARMGFPRMAVGACYGAPLLNILFGVGISCLIATTTISDPYPFELSSSLTVSLSFLIASLVSSVVFMVINKFSAGRGFGIFLVVLYIAFLVAAVTVEVMHV